MRRTVHHYNAKNRLPDKLIQRLQCASRSRNNDPKDALPLTLSYDGTALPHPDMPITHDGCDPARRGRRDGSTRNNCPPPTPTYTCRCGGTRPPTPTRPPKIDISCSPAKLADFCARWRQFQNGSSIPAAQAPAQLLQCLEDEMFSTATRAIGPKIDALDVEELLLELKQVAVIPVAIGMRRSEALSAKQAAGERFQQFTARVKGW